MNELGAKSPIAPSRIRMTEDGIRKTKWLRD